MSRFYKEISFLILAVILFGSAFAVRATVQDCQTQGKTQSSLDGWGCYAAGSDSLSCLDGNACGNGQVCCRPVDCNSIHGGGWSCISRDGCSGTIEPYHCPGNSNNICCGPATSGTQNNTGSAQPGDANFVGPLPAGNSTGQTAAATINSNTICGTAILNGSLLAALNAPNQMSVNLFTVLIYNVVVLILCIVGALTLMMIVYGGITMMISGGSSKTVEKGKQIITDAIIGLVIVLTAYLLVHFVVDTVLGAQTVFNK